MPKLERVYEAIPQPTEDPKSLLKTLKAVMVNVEVLCGMRPRVPGLADQLTDIRSSAEGREARYTEYIEVSTANNEALVQRTTTLEADMYDSNGRVSSVDTARATGDTALGSRIDTVEATTNGGTASGRIAFVASAGPTGWATSYDLTLTAKATGGSPVKTGMALLAKVNSDGTTTSRIVFTASQFALFDPNLGPTAVFNYQDNLFTFNVPVNIRSGDIARRAITVPFFNRNSNGNGGGSANLNIIVDDADTVVDLTALFDGQPSVTYTFTTTPQYMYLLRSKADGSETYMVQQKVLQFYIGGNSDNRFIAYTETCILAQDKPGIGSFIYTAITSTSYGPVTIKALAAKR